MSIRARLDQLETLLQRYPEYDFSDWTNEELKELVQNDGGETKLSAKVREKLKKLLGG